MHGERPPEATLDACIRRMRRAGMPPAVIAHFAHQHEAWRMGVTGRVPLDEVGHTEAGDLVDGDRLPPPDREHRAELLRRLVVIKLNGGLGTTMHLDRAKSLIEVREGRSFLGLMADQIERLRQRTGARLPLLLMNSFRTRDDTRAALAGFANPDDLPLDFIQHRVPRVEARSGRPYGAPEDTASWAPPGHGDVYLALHTSGLLDRLLDRGYRWAFISNGDNLGATVEPRLCSDFVERGRAMAMEVTDKTPMDRKGGTLVRRGGRLFLLERSMVDEAEMPGFTDLERFPVFNTNSLWIDLMAVRVALHGGLLELPLIVNRKRVHGEPILQFETAMGAAIGCFRATVGYRVPRTRFAPVKSTEDLMVMRSDAYRIDHNGAVRPAPERDLPGPPTVTLDPIYAPLDAFEARVPHPVGLRRCRSLEVRGDVSIGQGVQFEGRVVLRARQAAVADGARFTDGAWRHDGKRWVADVIGAR